MVHVENLPLLLARKVLHAPNHAPADGRAYVTIHAVDVQASRHQKLVPCGPLGTIHDYVGFYFGRRSPMLYRLHTGYNVTKVLQADIAYLVSSVQEVVAASLPFVFTDGHSLATLTAWFDDLDDLSSVDWRIVNANQWNDTPEHPDRQRRKQAEFLVYQSVPWHLIEQIIVLDPAVAARVEGILSDHPVDARRPVRVERSWYY
ncbi:MAG: DUF4433 domain-containing protein [Chloroflexota bacterium]|nr:MAG: DUF4433 domain-containing protein [Chloroflexota bacterium]